MDIREKTERKVFHYIEENHMVTAHDRIVAGVSGGADSVCLLVLLLEYGKKVPLRLAAAHVNHGVRPDAGEDAKYVEELCKRAGIPFFLTTADVGGQAAAWKCSEEAAGRRIRYEAFSRAAEGGTIAVAHNSGDNAETMLFHLFRGSGLKGLCGIAPVRREGQSKVIRPLLCLERREIEAYLRERGILWRTDSTNSEDAYCRNRIRHHILPYAQQEVAPGAVGHMRRTAEMLRETEAYLEQETARALGECLETRGGEPPYRVNVERFLGYHGALQKRMILALLEELSPTGRDIAAVHVRDVLSLFAEGKNRDIVLPFGITAARQYGSVTIVSFAKAAFDKASFDKAAKAVSAKAGMEASAKEAKAAFGMGGELGECGREVWDGDSISVPILGETADSVYTCGLGELGKMEFRVFFAQKDQKLPRNRYTKWFDYDKIGEALMVRRRERGDFLTISDGAGGMSHKSLKDYMITEKIPRQLRDRIPVVAAGSHVLWLTGRRISEYFKVDGNTERILQVKLYRDCLGGETEDEYVGTH